MAQGEGPGWHRESRRHSEVQQNRRPTHAKASKTPKDLSEAYRKMNLAYKRADRAFAEGRDEEGQAFEDEAQRWGKEHTRLLNKHYNPTPTYPDGTEIKVQAAKTLNVLQERAVKETKKGELGNSYPARVRVNQEFQEFIDGTKGMSNAEVRSAVAKKARKAKAALRQKPFDPYTYYANARWEDARTFMEMPFVVNAG